jgi:uncharacterized secreted protein with C-terminal beta-propeller domain
MSDEELDRILRESRPPTAADDGWTNTPAGQHALIGIRARVATANRLHLMRPRRRTLVGLGIGLAAATAAAIAVGLAAGPPTDHGPSISLPTHRNGPVGPVPEHMALVAYTGCDAMLDQLRTQTADHVGPYGLSGYGGGYLFAYGELGSLLSDAPSAAGVKSADATPAHSTTNTQEIGVGEPDIVNTDGTRIVSVSGGVLRVVDAATHDVTGSLDLGVYAGAQNAQLLMSGDRALVLLTDYPTSYYYDSLVYPGPFASTPSTTALLVDLSHSDPTIVDTLHADGAYVDARMVDGTARLVVQSRTDVTFPTIRGHKTRKQRIAAYRAAVNRAPIGAWLPKYQVTTGGKTTTHSVPCTSISHPAHYTGASMLTVYTVPLTGDLANPQPISLAATGANVYASTDSLYVADLRPSKEHGPLTQLDRFDITGDGKPTYLGSNMVEGALLNSYSMSEYDGALRVVTTLRQYRRNAHTRVYVLDEHTLKVDGSVGGLGKGEQVRAVRFIGPLGYVVTFRSVDPMYVLDLSNPAHPRVTGELKVPGYSDYLHPVGDGRLLGVGENTSRGLVRGLQVSLFDINSPHDPKRLANVTREHTPSESPIDPHAFLYWAADGIAVIPIDSWNYRQSGAALVVRVAHDDLKVLGTIRNPGGSSNGYDSGIERTLVIGDQLWTMSNTGLRVSDLHSLDREAWVRFS